MIDYGIIAKSIEFYESKGIGRIEAPWTVSQQISAITKPPEAQDYVLNHNGKSLVASAEQSFLYLRLKGFMKDGLYQAVTPCFRDDMFDLLHTKYFVKNELISVWSPDKDRAFLKSEAEKLAAHAAEFFRQYFNRVVRTATGPDSFDLVAGIPGQEVELGSYGVRRHHLCSWAYGTGAAEPRMSDTMKKIKFDEENNKRDKELA